jgi:hypothetical protein
MPVYRLDPINLNDPKWRTSTEDTSLWASAAHEGAARDLVAMKTTAVSSPSERHAWLTQSPWYDYRLTTCTLDTSKGQIPDGTVIRVDGRQI